jgi:hypothetical protein
LLGIGECPHLPNGCPHSFGWFTAHDVAATENRQPVPFACELMLNRLDPDFREALDTRRTVTGELRACLREIPASPIDWASFDPARALSNHATSPDLRLASLARLLCSKRVVRAWGVPGHAAAAGNATAVYLARLFAIELIAPEFCAPGMLGRAIEEVGLDPASLSTISADATIVALSTSLQ